MTRKGPGAFIGSLIEDRRPKRFRAAPEDAEMLRFAIELRSRRPGHRDPEATFVASLHEELAARAEELFWEEHRAAATVTSITQHEGRRPRADRRMATLVRAAAAVVAIAGGAVAATNVVDHRAAPAGHAVVASASMRFGILRTADGAVAGQVFIHRGAPSWMFVSVDARTPDQSLVCELDLANGLRVPVRSIQVHDGVAQLAHEVPYDLSAIRGVSLVTPGGETLARASLS